MAAMVDRRISMLNPDAPAFDPVGFRQVEDFSPKWWELVRTSKWFRDFWLSVNSEDEFDCGEFSDVEEQFEEMIVWSEEEEIGGSAAKQLNDPKALMRVLNMADSPPREKGNKSLPMPFFPKYSKKKTSKYASPNFSCRRNHHIYQPR